MKKFRLLLLCLVMLIPQISQAELVVRPMLPKGNLSNLGMERSNLPPDTYFSRLSWGAPYQMNEGGKRVYGDLWLHQGIYREGLDIEYEPTGNWAGAGFDYKLGSGYLSVGYEQSTYKVESTQWDTRSDGYKQTYDYNDQDMALQYVHELTDETTVGLLAINKNTRRERTDSVKTGTLSSGKKEETGKGDVSYLAYTLFSRIKLSKLFSLGVSYDSPISQKLEYDGDFSDSYSLIGNGACYNIALGLQTERFALEAALRHEAEQTETLDGRVIGASMFGEFLIGNSFSLLFKVAQNEEDEYEHKGTTYASSVHQRILYGAKLATGFGTYSGAIRTEIDDSGDNNYGKDYLQLSALFNF